MRPGNTQSTSHRPDYIFIFVLGVLIIFGLVMVYDASIAKAYSEFGDQYYFLKNQAVGVVFGGMCAVVVYCIDYHYWKKVSVPLLVIGLILLVAVFIPGLSVKAYGSQRWLNLGVTLIQPSEIIKLCYAIYIASLLSGKKTEIRSFVYGFIPFLAITGVIFLIIFLQPDLGTASQIIMNGVLMFFVAGGSIIQMAVIFPLLGAVGFGLMWMAPYRRDRLLTFLNPTTDLLGKSYHINQILIALGSGGWFGLGFGSSRQKYQYLPEVMTDSIFAVIGEELGFIGVLLVLFVFFIFIWRGLKIIQDTQDKFGQILATGIIGWISIQALVNLGAMSSIIPLTGVPLPFISYGRSSIVTILIGAGILLNISKHTLQEKKEQATVVARKR